MNYQLVRRRGPLAERPGDAHGLQRAGGEPRDQLCGCHVGDGELLGGEPAGSLWPGRDVVLGCWGEQVRRDEPFCRYRGQERCPLPRPDFFPGLWLGGLDIGDGHVHGGCDALCFLVDGHDGDVCLGSCGQSRDVG